MKLSIAVLPGDGIGPEVVAQAEKALSAIADRFGHQFSFTPAYVGAMAIDHTGDPLPEDTLSLCKKSDAVLLGAIGRPDFNDPTKKVRPEQGLLRLRKELGLFTNIRPVKYYSRLAGLSPLKQELLEGTDLVIYRELTSGIYFGEKGRSSNKDSAYDICAYNKEEVKRIAHLAYQAAAKRKGNLCLVDKANVMETSRLWREEVEKIAPEYPDVTTSYLYVDNAAMQLILNPSRFDVLLTSNLFGDILSDEASIIAGSLGLLPSASIGTRYCMFEPVHGSYPEAAGQDIANPMATILSAAMLLEHFNLDQEAQLIYDTIDYCMQKSILTTDLNPDQVFTCSQLGDVIQALILDEDGLKMKSIREGVSSII